MGTYKVTQENYKKICDEIGVIAKIHFLVIKKGRLGFSSGPPEEIRWLYGRILDAGYRPTKAFNKFMNYNFMRYQIPQSAPKYVVGIDG